VRPDFFSIASTVEQQSPFMSLGEVGDLSKAIMGQGFEQVMVKTLTKYLGRVVTRQPAGSKIDYYVGQPYGGIRDGAECKSAIGTRSTMFINVSKITPRPQGRLWFVFCNYDGAWIIEYERGVFEQKYVPRTVDGWSEQVYVVPVTHMTPIASFR